MGGWVKEVKGRRSTDWQSQNSHRDVKYSVVNLASNTVTTMHSAREILEKSGGIFCQVFV